jgi:hypothetical protein
VTATISATEWHKLATEKQLHDMLRAAALRNDYLVYHTHDSRRSDAGFPDLICIKRGAIFALELKAQKGRVSAQQEMWLNAWSSCGAYAAVVRPEPKGEGEISYDYAISLLEEMA